MKILTRLAAVAFVLALPACTTIDGALTAVTTTIANPVGPTNIYQIKNAYAAGDALVINYRRYCWAAPYAAIMADPIAGPTCQNRRAVVRAAQSARAKASAAINAADKFVRANPTLSAASLLSAAWSAVSDYKAAVPVVKS